jgi:hypothetical protein
MLIFRQKDGDKEAEFRLLSKAPKPGNEKSLIKLNQQKRKKN